MRINKSRRYWGANGSLLVLPEFRTDPERWCWTIFLEIARDNTAGNDAASRAADATCGPWYPWTLHTPTQWMWRATNTKSKWSMQPFFGWTGDRRSQMWRKTAETERGRCLGN